MFTPTIFLPEVDSNKKKVSIDDSKIHHLKNVLRVKDFDSVNISNGVGELFLGHLVKNHVEINSQKKYSRKNEISLFVPYLREKNRFRFMIEKLVELNVCRLVIGKPPIVMSDLGNYKICGNQGAKSFLSASRPNIQGACPDK